MRTGAHGEGAWTHGRSRDPWPHWVAVANIRAVLAARGAGAAVSLNQVRLDHTRIAPGAVVMAHALCRFADVARCAVVGPYASLFWSDVGAFAAVAQRTTVGAMPHHLQFASVSEFGYSRYLGVVDRDQPPAADPESRTTIGPDVWLGTGATVLNGRHVGCGAIVGAGAVVTHDIAPYEIVGGVPARHIRMRFDVERAARLLALQWWAWPGDVLHAHAELFRQPLTEDVLEVLEAVEIGQAPR